MFEGSIAATTSSSIGSGIGAEFSRTDFGVVAGIDFFTAGRLGFGATAAFGFAALAKPGFGTAFVTGFAGAGLGATGFAVTGFCVLASLDSSSVTFASAFASFVLVFDSFAFSFYFFITRLLS